MEKMDEKFVSKLVTAWVERIQMVAFLNILMDYSENTLNDIIQVKPVAFEREPGQPMSSLELFCSLEMFKELVECVQYLHSYEKSFVTEFDMLRKYFTKQIFTILD